MSEVKAARSLAVTEEDGKLYLSIVLQCGGFQKIELGKAQVALLLEDASHHLAKHVRGEI